MSEGNVVRVASFTAGYSEMAKDEESEGQALDWSESLLADAVGLANETW